MRCVCMCRVRSLFVVCVWVWCDTTCSVASHQSEACGGNTMAFEREVQERGDVHAPGALSKQWCVWVTAKTAPLGSWQPHCMAVCICLCVCVGVG